MFNVMKIPVLMVLLGTVVMISGQSTASQYPDPTVDHRILHVETLLSEIRELRQDLKKAITELGYGCVSGWILLPATRKYYRVIFEMMDWSTADRRCRELSGKSHLVVVENETENNAIKEFLRSIDTDLSRICNQPPAVLKAPWYGGYWTSGRRAEMSCGSTPWVWNPYPDVVMNMTFTDFAPSEPNCLNALNSAEHYAHFCTVGWNNLQWNDLDGGWPLCALCEFD